MVHNCFVVVSQFLICAKAELTAKLCKPALYEVCGRVTWVMSFSGPQVMAPPALYIVLPPTSSASLLPSPYHMSPFACFPFV